MGRAVIRSLFVLCIAAILMLLFFPLFQRSGLPPNGLVVDGFQRPIPGAKLWMRDQSGHGYAEVITGSDGRFRGVNLSQATIEGYGPAQARPRTGSGTLYVFAPLGTQTATFRDAAGHPFPGLAVILQAGSQNPNTYITDSQGRIVLNAIPLTTRLQMRIADTRLVIGKIRTTLTSKTLDYSVSVTPPAAIRGRVLSATNQPLKGMKPFAAVGPDTEHHSRLSARWLPTGTDGSFQIVGLPPGTYFVTAAQVYHPVTSVQRVTLAAGQTKDVTLHVSL